MRGDQDPVLRPGRLHFSEIVQNRRQEQRGPLPRVQTMEKRHAGEFPAYHPRMDEHTALPVKRRILRRFIHVRETGGTDETADRVPAYLIRGGGGNKSAEVFRKTHRAASFRT